MSEFERKLENWIQRLRGFSSAAEEIAAEAAPGIDALIKLEFALGINPDGKNWRKLAPSTRKRGRTPPPLTDTEDMRDSASAKAEGAAIRCHVDSPAQYHQGGTANMPARRILPTGRKLPQEWFKVIDAAYEKVVLNAH